MALSWKQQSAAGGEARYLDYTRRARAAPVDGVAEIANGRCWKTQCKPDVECRCNTCSDRRNLRYQRCKDPPAIKEGRSRTCPNARPGEIRQVRLPLLLFFSSSFPSPSTRTQAGHTTRVLCATKPGAPRHRVKNSPHELAGRKLPR